MQAGLLKSQRVIIHYERVTTIIQIVQEIVITTDTHAGTLQ